MKIEMGLPALIVTVVIVLVVGFCLGRLWDGILGAALDALGVARAWLEAALILAGVAAVGYLVLHYGAGVV